MKFSQLSILAINTIAVIFLAPAIAFSQPERPNRLQPNLTEAQKQQMQSLRASTRTQINAVLTPMQKTQLESAIKSGTRPQAAMQALNLSKDQKSKMRVIRESIKTQRQALLTPEQRQQLEKSRANRPNLNLSEDQRQKMQALRQNTRQKISAILTPEQKAQFDQAKGQNKNEQGKRRGDRNMASLNLTEDQKAQIKTIRDASKQEVQAILTPTQLQELQKMREQRGNRQDK